MNKPVTSVFDRYFSLSENGTSIRQECLAGLVNFMAMAYCILVVPGMLADAGMPHSAAISATVWASAIGTLLMGLFAKFPAAVAPGIGITAYFAYQICGGAGYTWQTALGAVFISGIIFLCLTLTRVRQLILRSVPNDLKYAIVVGIGAFIAFIGMKNCGLVVADQATFVKLGDLARPESILAILGLLGTAFLLARGVRSAMLLGIIGVTLVAMVCGVTKLPSGPMFDPGLLFPTDLFLQMDIVGALSHGLLSIIISLTIVDMFDSMGVLIGLASKAGFFREDGSIAHLDQAMISDSLATMSGGVLGVPTVTSYLECSAGVAAGGRTGLAAVVTAILFMLSLLLAPLVMLVPLFATAPVLILVGALMMQDVGKIDFSRFEVALPAFLTIVTMPLTFNISTGFGMGFLSWTLLRILLGRWKEVNPVMLAVSACLAVNFVMR